MTKDYIRYGKYLKLNDISESFYAKSYKSKFFGSDNFYKIFAFEEISESITEDPIVFDKFMKIIKANSKLNHSNIIKIIDFHDFHDTYALITEYFAHEPLIALMASYFKRKKKIPVIVAVFIITQVCDAVGYAQSNSVFHGNLNPMNILITHEGLIKVKEFSFYNNLSLSTHVKALNFKQFRYIAPENFEFNQVLPESDVYSLAVILYEMLTGKVIYSSKDMSVLVQKIKEGNFTPILKLNPDIPAELAELVEKGLSLKPSERFEDPIKFKYAIQKYLIQGHKLFSAQHFYMLMSKLFASQVSKELSENSSYRELKLDDYENRLKVAQKDNEYEDFVPEIDEDLFEGDDDATSILFNNVEEEEEISNFEEEETIGVFTPNATANVSFYEDDDDKTAILDDDDEIENFNPNLYNNEDEKTAILNDEEESTPIELIPDKKKRKKKKKEKNIVDKQNDEYKKLLNDESSFDLKSFIIGMTLGIIIGLGIAFVLLK